MVGAHSSMPDTFDGYGILAQAEMRGVREGRWSRGTITGTSGRKKEGDVDLEQTRRFITANQTEF